VDRDLDRPSVALAGQHRGAHELRLKPLAREARDHRDRGTLRAAQPERGQLGIVGRVSLVDRPTRPDRARREDHGVDDDRHGGQRNQPHVLERERRNHQDHDQQRHRGRAALAPLRYRPPAIRAGDKGVLVDRMDRHRGEQRARLESHRVGQRAGGRGVPRRAQRREPGTPTRTRQPCALREHHHRYP